MFLDKFKSRAMPLRSLCFNKFGSDEKKLASNVGSQSKLSPSCYPWYALESDFAGDLVQATLHCVGQASLQMANLDISLCNIRKSGLFFPPPNHRDGERHLARTIYPSCKKPHTRYATNVRGPTFISVTHFTLQIKFITFLNEQTRI